MNNNNNSSCQGKTRELGTTVVTFYLLGNLATLGEVTEEEVQHKNPKKKKRIDSRAQLAKAKYTSTL